MTDKLVQEPAMQQQKSVYTLQFGLLCLSSFLFFSSFNMVIPELPAYITRLGGEEYKGLLIALFTLTAGLSRPFSGKFSDKIGRISVMVFGAVICFVCGFLYTFVTTVTGLLLLRLLHGFSTGFQPTGTSAYVADIVPANRRGEAIGILGLSGSTGMAMGPAIGSVVSNNFDLDTMFYASSLAALLSLVILAGLKETVKERAPLSWNLLSVSPKEVLEPRVLAPSFVMLLTSFAYGVILTLIPDFSVHLGVQNKGLFFTIFTLSSLGIRFLAGRFSDRFGRVMVLRCSTILLSLALLLIGLAASPTAFFVGAVVFGIANGMNSPTIYAWAIDLSDEQHRGRGMATIYIALEIGIGLGALISGWIYSNKAAMFPYAFWAAGLLCACAFLYLNLKHKVAKAVKV
jgi:MFS family permease